jgi:uncharacterized OB-fold protein
LEEVPECGEVFAPPGRACMSRRMPMPWLDAVRVRILTEDHAFVYTFAMSPAKGVPWQNWGPSV